MPVCGGAIFTRPPVHCRQAGRTRNAPHRDPWSSGGTGKPVPMTVPRGKSRVPLTRRMPVTAPAIQSCIYRMPTWVCGFLLCLGGAQRHRACRGVCGRRESRVVSGDCLEMGWCAVMSRFGVGVCAAMGWCAVMSRICVGVCHGCADWAVCSRKNYACKALCEAAVHADGSCAL